MWDRRFRLSAAQPGRFWSNGSVIDRSRHIPAKHHPAHPLPQSSNFVRVGRSPEFLSQIEELPLLPLIGLASILNVFQEDPVSTQSACLRHTPHLRGQVPGKTNTLPNCVDYAH